MQFKTTMKYHFASTRIASNEKRLRNSLAVQWLGPHASFARGMGLIPGWDSHKLCGCSQKKRKKERKKEKEEKREHD